MKRSWMRTAAALLSLFLLFRATEGVPAAEPVVRPHARLAIVGDSITEQKLYSSMIETYLTACARLDVNGLQAGLGGETAAGFLKWMDDRVLPFHPDAVTICFGMNDLAGGPPWPEDQLTRFEATLREAVARLHKAGALVVVGSPGAVDSTFARNGDRAVARQINDRLRDGGAIARKIAGEFGLPFADVHTPLMSAMEKAKTALGDDYDVCGRDGVHPRPNGHLVYAYAFLKAMGLDGNIGRITVDMKGNATATEGHKIISSDHGRIEIESSRYPFCFYGDTKTSESTRSIVPFVPFNQDLNRFTLVVTNLAAAKATVRWGAAEKTFSREQLEQGINLAAEFLDNPFAEPFQRVFSDVLNRQIGDTALLYSQISQFGRYLDLLGHDAEAVQVFVELKKRLFEKQLEQTAAVHARFQPVRHALVIVEKP